MTPKRTTHIRGFTLMELIVVIVLVGIIATVTVRFIELPVRGYVDLTRRTELVDSAEQALRMIQREIRNALPNSIRIAALGGGGSGSVIEFINVKAVGRYRDRPGGPGIGIPDCRLQFSLADTSFDVVHDFEVPPLAAGDRLVISNWSATGPAANAYVGDNITPTTTTLTLHPNDPAPTGCGEDRISLSAGMKFPFASANKRFYVVDQPIAYLCDTAAGTLTRFAGHPIASVQLNTSGGLTSAGAIGALVTDHVAACGMTYVPGSPQRGGMVILDLALSDGGEQIRLLHQVHVENAP